MYQLLSLEAFQVSPPHACRGSEKQEDEKQEDEKQVIFRNSQMIFFRAKCL